MPPWIDAQRVQFPRTDRPGSPPAVLEALPWIGTRSAVEASRDRPVLRHEQWSFLSLERVT